MIHSEKEKIKIGEEPSVPPEILEAASSGKLVVFIGAGVSRILGCPSWENLALKLLENLRKKKAINYHEYEKLRSLDARKLLSICRNIYKKSKRKPPSMKSLLKGTKDLLRKYKKIYDDLYSFNSIYITTNYDDFLDKIIEKPISESGIKMNSKDELQISPNKGKTKGNVFYQKEAILISNLENGNLIHFHGSMNDEKNLIMTIVEYMYHYKYGDKPACLLEEVFKNYTVLFVGYGLEEYEIIEFLVSKSSAGKGEIKHFLLYPIFEGESNLLKFYQEYYRDLGIQLVPYFIDKNGYEQLATVIHKWAKQIGPISQPQKFLERIKLIDEVIE